MKGKITTTLILMGVIIWLGGQLYLINEQKKAYELYLKKQKRSLVAGLGIKWRNYLITQIEQEKLIPEYSLIWDRTGTILTKPFFPEKPVSLNWEDFSKTRENKVDFLKNALNLPGSWDRVLAIHEWKKLNLTFDNFDLSPFEKTVVYQEAYDAYRQLFTYVSKLNYYTFSDKTWQYNKLFYRALDNGDLETAIPSLHTVTETLLPDWLKRYEAELVSIGPLPWHIQLNDNLKNQNMDLNPGLRNFIHATTIILFLMAFLLFQWSLKDKKTELLSRVTFLNQIVHEIKTPLTAIRIHSDILKDLSGNLTGESNLQNQDSGQFKKSLKALYRNVDRLNQLFDDIISVNRPFKKAAPSILKAGDAMQLCQEASGTYGENLVTEGKITKDLLSDRSRFRIVLNNLISNAIKYGRKAHLTLEESETFCRLQVKDEGSGISRADAKKIFSQFYRTGKAEKGRAGGLGLGLFIASKLAKESGARLWLDNPGEKHATFIFEIPLKIRSDHEL